MRDIGVVDLALGIVIRRDKNPFAVTREVFPRIFGVSLDKHWTGFRNSWRGSSSKPARPRKTQKNLNREIDKRRSFILLA